MAQIFSAFEASLLSTALIDLTKKIEEARQQGAVAAFNSGVHGVGTGSAEPYRVGHPGREGLAASSFESPQAAPLTIGRK